jgi:long-chain acyl-CoA synthetase
MQTSDSFSFISGVRNLGQLLHQSAHTTPNAKALICGDRQMSFEELDRSTDALARWFMVAGFQQGDRVAIHWSNSIEAVQLYFACFKAGMIAVPLNIRLKAPEIVYILGHSKAKICFSQPELAYEELPDECPDLLIYTSTLPDLTSKQYEHPSQPQVAADQLAAILYTSGTTARPKGVLHTHASLLNATGMMCSLGIPSASCVLTVSQLMHIGALACVLLPGLAVGSTVVLLSAFDAGEVLDLIERWRCSYLFLLPAMLQFVAEEQSQRPRETSSLKMCLAGGDTVSVTLQNRFHQLFGLPVYELYGMTESVPVTCNRKGLVRAGSVGRALDVVKTRLVGPLSQEVHAGQVGELQVQSPANCVGYWADPQATAATLDGGWLRTGDLMKRDDDRFLWFAGRAKQIIIRDGSNISPQEVEEVLYRHPATLEAGVVGLPDPVHGEKVVAFVTRREGTKIEETELLEWTRGQIADYKVPEQILFLPALPKGLTGKVQRRDLKEIYATVPEQGASAALAMSI